MAINLREIFPEEGLTTSDEETQTSGFGYLIEDRYNLAGTHLEIAGLIPVLLRPEITVDTFQIAGRGQFQ